MRQFPAYYREYWAKVFRYRDKSGFVKPEILVYSIHLVSESEMNSKIQRSKGLSLLEYQKLHASVYWLLI